MSLRPFLLPRSGTVLQHALFWTLLAGCGARSAIEPAGTGAASSAGAGSSGAAAGAGGIGAGGTGIGGTGIGGTGIGGSGGAGAGSGAGGSVEALSILDACVIAASCGIGNDWPSFTVGSCLDGFARLDWWYDPPGWLPDPTLAARVRECATKAQGDCAAFQACYGGDWVSLGRCREGASCFDNVMAASLDGATFDCGAIGATCVDLWSGALRACCNAEPCAQPSEVVCSGTVATFCGGWGEYVTFDCAESGRTCTPDKWSPCAGAEPCDPMTATTCMGNTAVYCSAGGLATYDCDKTLFRSACNAGGLSNEPPCRPEGDACDPIYDPDTCDGSMLQVCADGLWTSVGCKDLGFAGCTEAMGDARCTN